MSDPSDFTVEVRNDRDIVISKPEEGFEVTYRREVYSPRAYRERRAAK